MEGWTEAGWREEKTRERGWSEGEVNGGTDGGREEIRWLSFLAASEALGKGVASLSALWIFHRARRRGECAAGTQSTDNEPRRNVQEVVFRVTHGDPWAEWMGQSRGWGLAR